jgi:hypothetical protein
MKGSPVRVRASASLYDAVSGELKEPLGASWPLLGPRNDEERIVPPFMPSTLGGLVRDRQLGLEPVSRSKERLGFLRGAPRRIPQLADELEAS